MMQIEQTYMSLSTTCKKNCLIICDRGTMDASACKSQLLLRQSFSESSPLNCTAGFSWKGAHSKYLRYYQRVLACGTTKCPPPLFARWCQWKRPRQLFLYRCSLWDFSVENLWGRRQNLFYGSRMHAWYGILTKSLFICKAHNFVLVAQLGSDCCFEIIAVSPEPEVLRGMS